MCSVGSTSGVGGLDCTLVLITDWAAIRLDPMLYCENAASSLFLANCIVIC